MQVGREAQPEGLRNVQILREWIMCKKCTTERTKLTPQLEIDGDTGELYTPVGMLKKEWADAARKNAEQEGHKGE